MTIIAILIFGLSILPCADKGQCAKVETHQVADHDHEDQKQLVDHCSPLCVCNCCSTVTTHFEFKLLEDINQFDYLRLLEEIEFRIPFVSTLHYPIWQPPQLV